MDTMNNLAVPIMRCPTDVMRKGPNSDNFQTAAIQAHTIDRLQRAQQATGTAAPLDLDAIRRLYGSGLAMRLSTERRLAQNVGGRLPGMDAHPDSNIVMETLTGEDVSIDFGDYLNIREDRCSMEDHFRHGDGTHTAMEKCLGL